MIFTFTSSIWFLSAGAIAAAQEAAFSPCPLLGPRFPIPRSTSSSSIVREGASNLTNALDAYLRAGDGEFGPIFPNTTSFSILLFSTDETKSTVPFFHEYHHSARSLQNITRGIKAIDANSIYRIGDLTQLFTAYLFLIEAGETYWSDSVTSWVPELASNTSSSHGPKWDDISLGDLAAHLSGIGKYSLASERDIQIAGLLNLRDNGTSSSCETGSDQCTRAEFLQYIGGHRPVFEPGSTPIFSNAGYIILAYALESIKGKSYRDLLKNTILEPLNLTQTSLRTPPDDVGVIPNESSETNWDDPLPIEAPFNGLYSSPSDVAAVLRSILSSSLLKPAETRRWLKPVTHTSNRANSVGRPWEIYSLTVGGPSPVIPVYQVRGNVGLYSSHIGLVPDYNTGFVILAADSERNPDMNAYADLISVALIPALEENAITQASLTFSGTYTDANNAASLTIAPAKDSTPGLSLTHFTSGSTDIRALYAQLNNIEPENLSVRLYPTNLNMQTETGEGMAFRAVFQDVTELADAGTPTCDTWRYVDALQVNGEGLDEFRFELDGKGKASKVKIGGLRLQLT